MRRHLPFDVSHATWHYEYRYWKIYIFLCFWLWFSWHVLKKLVSPKYVYRYFFLLFALSLSLLKVIRDSSYICTYISIDLEFERVYFLYQQYVRRLDDNYLGLLPIILPESLRGAQIIVITMTKTSLAEPSLNTASQSLYCCMSMVYEF